MTDVELKRGYEVLPDNNVRFGIRVINSSDAAILDVEVILDYNESLFELAGSEIQKLGTIPPAGQRTAKFILKPRGCTHKEEIAATVRYKDPHGIGTRWRCDRRRCTAFAHSSKKKRCARANSPNSQVHVNIPRRGYPLVV